jgi:hypothetical protein
MDHIWVYSGQGERGWGTQHRPGSAAYFGSLEGPWKFKK